MARFLYLIDGDGSRIGCDADSGDFLLEMTEATYRARRPARFVCDPVTRQKMDVQDIAREDGQRAFKFAKDIDGEVVPLFRAWLPVYVDFEHGNDRLALD